MRTLTTRGEIRADHTLTVIIPDDIPAGPAPVTVTIDPDELDKINTLGDFLRSEFFGAWSDRDDLPKTQRGVRGMAEEGLGRRA